MNCPGGQLPHRVAEDEEFVPGGHVEHDPEPSCLAKVPGGHGRQRSRPSAPGLELKLPRKHL